MKSVSELLSIYKSSHLNKKNIITHFFGIPLILWSAALFFATFSFSIAGIDTNVMQVIALVIFIYYLMLDIKLGAIAILLIAPIWLHAQTMVTADSPYLIAGLVFFVGWVLQFIGHYYEKAKPAFFDDLKQLLIGPLFLVAEVCFFLKLFASLEEKVTAEAIEIRKAMIS